jgi:hypothetical protein
MKQQFVGLQTAAEWLRLSIYFLTVWDIIVGTLCLLNSAYILYKICENPNRGRVGETRFSQTFWTKKGDAYTYKDVQGGDAFATYAICPPMSVSMPQVKCMTTPMSVRMKTPTRCINIEEYAESSKKIVFIFLFWIVFCFNYFFVP